MKKLSVLAAVALLAACTTTDPYTGERKTSNTAKGAGIGAAVGAAVGAAAADDRGKGALSGAAAGAAAGGGIGYYMDRQEEKLRQELQGTGVQVRREGDRIHLIMPGNITFATGRHEIRSEFYGVLDSVAKILAEFKDTAIKVSGHTDSTGGDQLNQTLSERRADSVREYLIQRQVAAGRIQAQGYGPRYPIASNDTASGRQANRRVELELLPMR